MSELLYPDKKEEFYIRNIGKFRAELHDRLSGPLYPFLFVLLAVVHLGTPRTTRESRIQDLFTAFVVATVLRVIGLASANMAVQTPAALALVWGIPLAGILVTAVMAHFEIKPMSLPSFSLPSWPWRTAKAAAG